MTCVVEGIMVVKACVQLTGAIHLSKITPEKNHLRAAGNQVHFVVEEKSLSFSSLTLTNYTPSKRHVFMSHLFNSVSLDLIHDASFSLI